MHKNIRIIPLLHITGPNVVTTVHTEALRVADGILEIKTYLEKRKNLDYQDKKYHNILFLEQANNR